MGGHSDLPVEAFVYFLKKAGLILSLMYAVRLTAGISHNSTARTFLRH